MITFKEFTFQYTKDYFIFNLSGVFEFRVKLIHFVNYEVVFMRVHFFEFVFKHFKMVINLLEFMHINSVRVSSIIKTKFHIFPYVWIRNIGMLFDHFISVNLGVP